MQQSKITKYHLNIDGYLSEGKIDKSIATSGDMGTDHFPGQKDGPIGTDRQTNRQNPNAHFFLDWSHLAVLGVAKGRARKPGHETLYLYDGDAVAEFDLSPASMAAIKFEASCGTILATTEITPAPSACVIISSVRASLYPEASHGMEITHGSCHPA